MTTELEPDDDCGDMADACDALKGKNYPLDKPRSTRTSGDSVLQAFASVQRQLAALDFSAVLAVQRAMSEPVAVSNIPAIIAAQQSVAKNFARSINFSKLGPLHGSLLLSDAAATADEARFQWADALTRAIDVSALQRANQAILSSGAVQVLAEWDQSLVESIRNRIDVLVDPFKALRVDIPKLDLSDLIGAFDRWIPANLRNNADLDGVAVLALDEGLPLSWIPRSEIVAELLAADGSEARLAILQARQHDILDDCETALADVDHEWARQCLNASQALRAGFDAPAQSHAANIIDSVVLHLHGKNARGRARQDARREFDDLPLQLAAENLTIRPLFRAFVTWWPSSNMVPPEYFSRHTTAHAVGYPNVFGPTSALMAVMLATSLTVQYSPDPHGSPSR